MAWRRITETDLLTRISGAELSAFRAAALAVGQADPIDDVLLQVTDLVRGYIAANRANTLGAAGTVPDKLISTAVDIAVMDVQKRAAGVVIDPEGARADACKDALRRLEKVADGKFAIEEPEEESTETIAGTPAPLFSGRIRQYGRTYEDGI